MVVLKGRIFEVLFIYLFLLYAESRNEQKMCQTEVFNFFKPGFALAQDTFFLFYLTNNPSLGHGWSLFGACKYVLNT